MRDYTKFRRKISATHLIPEQLDGYEYQFHITQEHRNTTGLLDTNPVFQGQVVAVKEIVGNEEDPSYVIFAKVSLLDEGIPDKENYTDYEFSEELGLLDTFIPETKDTIRPAVGQLVYLTYSDANNRLGGIYISPVKTFDFIDAIIKEVGELVDKAKEAFKSDSKSPTQGPTQAPTRPGGCNPSYSNCSGFVKGAGEYEIKFGDVQSYGFAKMVILDFNRKQNVVILEQAYKSLQKMFEDAKKQGVNLLINDGFRPYERQECFYNTYLECIKEWKKAGANDVDKPAPAGNPKRTKNTFSSHMNGKAADFNTGTSRKQQNMLDIFAIAKNQSASVALEETKKRLDLGKISTTKEWKWLVNNSQRYGWVWSGIRFREPWHFHFDENLAKKNNMV